MLTRSQSAWKRAIDRDIVVIGRIAWIIEHDMDYNKEVPLRINTLDGKRKMQKLDVHVPSMMPTVLTVDIINCEQQVVTTECTAAAGEWKQCRRKYNLDRLEEYDFSGGIDIDNRVIKNVIKDRRLMLIELFLEVVEILELPRSIIHTIVSILDRFVHIRSYNYIDNKSSVPYYLFVFLCCFMLAYKIETNKSYEATTNIRLWLLLLFNEQGNCRMELEDLNTLESAILVAIGWKLMTPNMNTFMHSVLPAFLGRAQIEQLSEVINESILADSDTFEQFPSSLLAFSSVTLANLLINHKYIELAELEHVGHTAERVRLCVIAIQNLFITTNIRNCEAIIRQESNFGSPVNASFASKDAHVTPELNEEKKFLDLNVSPIKSPPPQLHAASLAATRPSIYRFKSRNIALNAVSEKYLVSSVYCIDDAEMLLDKISRL